MRLKRLLLAGIASLLMGTGSSVADPLDITGINGVWQNQVGGLNVVGLGTSAITWGDGSPPESGYTFAAGADIIGAALGSPLFLGTFTHVNNEIPIPNLSAVDLVLSFGTNGAPPVTGATFNFLHDETSNDTGTSPADDDIVTITTPIVNIPIVVGTSTYFFNLLGFSKDGGATFQHVFTSPEGGSNAAGLYGQVTASQIPEPSSLLLFGTVLAGTLASRRRRG